MIQHPHDNSGCDQPYNEAHSSAIKENFKSYQHIPQVVKIYHSAVNVWRACENYIHYIKLY